MKNLRYTCINGAKILTLTNWLHLSFSTIFLLEFFCIYLDEATSVAKTQTVKVSDCDQIVSDPCPFVRGFNKTIEVDFTPSK